MRLLTIGPDGESSHWGDGAACDLATREVHWVISRNDDPQCDVHVHQPDVENEDWRGQEEWQCRRGGVLDFTPLYLP